MSAYTGLAEFVRANPAPAFQTRADLFRFLGGTHFAGKPICLMELGVACGNSMREWLCASESQDSRFYGLDTFEGLPEDWQHVFKRTPRGTFSTGRKVPDIDDSRVQFRKGRIQVLLGPLLDELESSHLPFVVHFDATCIALRYSD